MSNQEFWDMCFMKAADQPVWESVDAEVYANRCIKFANVSLEARIKQFGEEGGL